MLPSEVDLEVLRPVGSHMGPFRSIFATVLNATFEEKCGKWQADKPAPKAFQIQFALGINHETEDGYRTLEIALFAPHNYVQVWVRKTWEVIPLDDLEYAEGECIGTKPGKEYRKGASEWRKVADHDSCWREGVENILREYEREITVLRTNLDDWWTLIDPETIVDT